VKVTMTLSGQDKLARRLGHLQARIERAARGAIQVSAEELRDEAREALERGPATARRPEAMGRRAEESAAVAGSLFVEIDDDGLGARVGTALEAGRDLEFGTRETPARPWLFPTFEQLKPRIGKRLAEAVGKALKQHGPGRGRGRT